jgi:hypothetical protein
VESRRGIRQPRAPHRKEEWRAMDYLFVKLFWYLVPAFIGGFIVGWISCRPSED